MQHYVLKCQMYFKGLGFPFSPAFRIVSDTNIKGLFSYSSNSPNFSLKSCIYYTCQEKRKGKKTSLEITLQASDFFFFFAYNYTDAVSLYLAPLSTISLVVQPAEQPHTGATSVPNER